MSKPKKLFVVSDVHIGGEGILNKFEVKEEFIQFLHLIKLESKLYEIELIIVGDLFNLWDITSKKELEKFYYIEKTHKTVLENIKKLSEHISITLIPGNHDHDLACYKEYPDLLQKWGINLMVKEKLIRNFHGKKIVFEHGNQFDPTNKINNFGDPNDTPYGFHFKRDLILKVVRFAERNNKKRTWLADIPFFNYPYKIGPFWFLSNYFYHELAPLLRYIITPFLILFFFSLVLFIFAVLTYFKILNFPTLFNLTSYLGPARFIVNFIILYNFIFLFLFLIFYGIWLIIKRDFLKSLNEYGINIKEKLETKTKTIWYKKSKAILNKKENFDIYIFGHSHLAFLQKFQFKNKEKIVANSGAWMKTFHPVRSRFFLPSVFVPYFKLSYLTITKNPKNIKITLKFWPKKIIYNLTFIQRLSILFKKRGIELKNSSLTLKNDTKKTAQKNSGNNR